MTAWQAHETNTRHVETNSGDINLYRQDSLLAVQVFFLKTTVSAAAVMDILLAKVTTF